MATRGNTAQLVGWDEYYGRPVVPRNLYEHERVYFETDARKTAKALGHSLGHFNPYRNYWNIKETKCRKCGAGVELRLTDYLPGGRPLSGSAIQDVCPRQHKKIGKCKVGRLPPRAGWNTVRRAKFWKDPKGCTWRNHIFKAGYGYNRTHFLPLPDKPMLQLKAPGFLRGRCSYTRQPVLNPHQKNDIRNAYRAMDRIAIQESLESEYDETDVRQKRKWPPIYDDKAGGFTRYDSGRLLPYDPWYDDDGDDLWYGDGDDYDDSDPVKDFLRGRLYAMEPDNYEERREEERQAFLWDGHDALTEEDWEEHDRLLMADVMRVAPPVEKKLDRKEARKITKKFNSRNKRRK